jgi:hypothetical protein
MNFLARFAALLLCLLLPLKGLAQTPSPVEEPAPSVTEPPLIPAPAQPQAPADSPRDSGDENKGEIIPREWPPAEDRAPAVPRILVEFLGGTVGGTLGAIPGTILFAANLCFSTCSDESETGAIFGLGLAFAGLVFGTAYGIDVGGDFMDGHGRFLPAAGGVALGSLVGLLGAGAVGNSSGEAGLLFAILGPVVGGIVGYELSNTPPVQRPVARASRTQVMPLVTTTPSGGLMGGLAGRF